MYQFLKDLVTNKKVLILGFGREGRSTYNVIKDMPCKIGIADKKGSLETGKDADIIITDSEFNVEKTIIGGKIKYEA